MVGDGLADPTSELLVVTIVRHRRGWRVMWISAGKNLRDFRAGTLTAAVTGASSMAAEFYEASLASVSAEFLMLIFGRLLPVFKGPQLIVTGHPGQFTAEDARDGSEFAGATLEDLLTAAGANPARAGDYVVNWTRPVSALRPDP